MLERSAKNLENISKAETARGDAMTDAATASEYMQDAFPVKRYGNAKAATWAAYRKLKLETERRARAIWNGEARRIDAHEMDALKKAVLDELHLSRKEALERIERLERELSHTVEDLGGGRTSPDQPRN